MCFSTIPYVIFVPIISFIVDRGISAPVHGKEVADGLNTIDKRYIYQVMSNVQLPGSKTFDSQILIHSFTHKIICSRWLATTAS